MLQPKNVGCDFPMVFGDESALAVGFAHAEGVGNDVLVLLIIVVIVVVVEDVILESIKQVSSILMLEGDKCRTDR